MTTPNPDRLLTDGQAAAALGLSVLENLGYELPEELVTHVHWITTGVRNRRWPQLEESQEV